MKKLSLFICSCIAAVNFSTAQQVYQYGDTLYSPGAAKMVKTAWSSVNGVVYSAFSDQTLSGKITVMHSNTYPVWSYAGSQGFSTGAVNALDIAIGASGFPIVAYTDALYSNKVIVRQWDGVSNWNFVGNSGGITAANVTDVSITYNSTTGRPSVAYRDPLFGGKLTVMTWDGAANWVVDGPQGFSTGSVANIHLGFSAAVGNNVVLYKDSTDMKAWFQLYNGSSWTLVSGGSFGAQILDLDMEISLFDDLPVIALADLDAGAYKPFYYKFNGISLSGQGPMTTTAVSRVAVSGDASGNIMIAHNNPASGNSNITVRLRKAGAVFFNANDIYCGAIGSMDIAGAGDEYYYVTYTDSSKGVQVNTRKITNLITGNTITPGGPVNICPGGSIGLSSTDVIDQTQQYSWIDSLRWDTIGIPGFTPLNVVEASYAVSKVNGTRYVAFRSGINGNKLSVYEFSGSVWSPLGGTTITPGTISYPQVKIDPYGFPVVAYSDGNNANKATVMRWDGISWNNVGTPGFSAGQALYVSLDLDAAGRPVVAYADGGAQKLTVMYFNGSNWQSLGGAGFTAAAISSPAVKFSRQGFLYTCFSDAANANEATLLRWNGTSWITMGSPGFSTGAVTYVSLDFNSYDDVFIGCVDAVLGSKATLYHMPFSTGIPSLSWANISASTATHTKVMIDQADNRYMAYLSPSNSKAIIKRYNFTTWDTVANKPFHSSTGSGAFDTDINNLGIPSGAIAATGSPLTAFELSGDLVANGDSLTVNQDGLYSLFFMKNNFEGALTANQVKVTVQPNPTITFALSQDSVCAGIADTIIANGANSYFWSTSSTNDTIIVNPTTTNTYTVTGTSTFGCNATTTVTVTVPTYGFAGNITLNAVPVTAGQMYVYFENAPGVFDSIFVRNIQPTGDYILDSIPNGNFLIEAEANSGTYPTAISTYNGNIGYWDSTNVIPHTCFDRDTVNIALLSEYTPTGPGLISGTVYEGAGFGLRLAQGPVNPTPNTNVIPGVPIKVGKNPGGSIVGGTTTDLSGNFQFDSLPCDTYFVYTDIPGYPMDTLYTVIIDCLGGADTFMNANYFIDSNSVYIDFTSGITQGAINTENSFITVYPNPSSGMINIVQNQATAEPVLLSVFTTEGKEVWRKQTSGGISTYPIDLSAAGKGIYVLRIIQNGKTSLSKIVIY